MVLSFALGEGGAGKMHLCPLPTHWGPVTTVPDLSLLMAVEAGRPTRTASALSTAPLPLEAVTGAQRRGWEWSF